jgi:hypothetical protein
MPGKHGRGGRGPKPLPPQGIMTRERLHTLLVDIGATCLQAGLEAEFGFPSDPEAHASYMAGEACRIARGADWRPQECWEEIVRHEQALSQLPHATLLRAALLGVKLVGRHIRIRKPSKPRPMFGLSR